MMSSHVVIGVDVGGTFTDILALDEAQLRSEYSKFPQHGKTNRLDFWKAFLKSAKTLKTSEQSFMALP